MSQNYEGSHEWPRPNLDTPGALAPITHSEGDRALQLAAVLRTLPPQAQHSAAIVAEVIRILETRVNPGPELAALQEHCWNIAMQVDARQDNRTVNYITNNVLVNSFNQNCNNQTDNSVRNNQTDNSVHNETHGWEMDWNVGRGLVFAIVAAIAMLLMRVGGFVEGVQYERGGDRPDYPVNSTPAYQPLPVAPTPLPADLPVPDADSHTPQQ